MKQKRMRFVLVLILSLLLLGVVTLVLPAKSFSESENRPLAQMPAVNGETVQTGTFQSGLSDYLSDQFPLRSMWMKLHTGMQKRMGKKEIGGVYVGKEHYYFKAFTDEDYSPNKMEAVFDLMDSFVQGVGLPTTVMLVPSPGTVLEDLLPAHAPYYDANPVYDAAKAQLSGTVIDLRAAFAASQDHTQLYYKTDHHWTTQAAYLAYEAYCKANHLTPEPYIMAPVTQNFYGTNHTKILDGAAKPDTILAVQRLPKMEVVYDDGTVSDSPYRPDLLEHKDQYTYFFGGNWGKITLNTQAKGGHLLVLKDSFANCFVPFLTANYAKITVVDLRHFEGDLLKLMEEEQVTDLLFLYEMSNLLTDTGIYSLGLAVDTLEMQQTAP